MILPSGPIPPNAAELLNSARMKELLQSLQEQADVLILDSPPVFAVTDAVILASMVTASILVVEAGKTPVRACSGAVEALKRAADNFAGVVLNNIEVQQRGYGGRYGYYGGYYSYGYGSAYGVSEGENLKSSKTGWQRVRAYVRRLLGRAR